MSNSDIGENLWIPSVPSVAGYASGNSLPRLREKGKKQQPNSKDKTQILFFARWETIESFGLSFLHTSRQYVFYEKPGRRPPKITGRRVSAVHQWGVRAPN